MVDLLDPAGLTRPRHTLQWMGMVALAFAANGACNVGLNLYNAWALHDSKDGPSLTFPIFYTTFHPIAGALGTTLILCIKPPVQGFPSFAQFWQYKMMLIPIGVCSALNVGLNNVSLRLISLFLNQVIKSTGPFPTMVLAFLIMGTTYTRFTMTTVAFLVGGTILALPMKGSATTEVVGILLVIVATCAQALKPVLMKSVFGKLSPMAVMFYDTSVSACCMLIYWLLSYERTDSIAYIGKQPGLAIGVISGGASMAFVFGVSSYFIIHLTSPLTANVFGNTLKVGLIVFSAFTTTRITAVHNWIGIGTVCLSVGAYVYSGQLAKQNPPKPLAAPPLGTVFAATKDAESVKSVPPSEATLLHKDGTDTSTCCLIC